MPKSQIQPDINETAGCFIDRSEDNIDKDVDCDEIKVLPPVIEVAKLNQQPVKGKHQKQHLSCFSASAIDEKGGYDPNRYRLHFAKESKEEIDSRKLAAQQMNLTMLPKESLELNIDEVFVLDSFIKLIFKLLNLKSEVVLLSTYSLR